MNEPRQRIFGIIAGGGSLPREVAASALADGHAVQIVAIQGEADDTFEGFRVERVGWGQFGRALSVLRSAGVTDVVLLGRVRRPDLWSIRPDLGLLRNLPEIIRIIASAGDDNLLRRVGRFFEARGMALRGAAELAPRLLMRAGPLGQHAMPADYDADVALGFAVIDALGAMDVGQAVIVRDGRVAAIEAAEGTDGLLARCTVKPAGSLRGVLVKAPKPGQELRLDMPAIGPGTVRRVHAAGLAGIAVQAGATLVAERAQLIDEAAELGVFVQGIDRPALVNAEAQARTPYAISSISRLTSAAQGDAIAGANAIDMLARFGGCPAAVVNRGHVTSIGAPDEEPAAVIERSGQLRQWGRARSSKRSGLAVIGPAFPLTADIIRAASHARLQTLVVTGGVIDRSLQAEARALGLTIAQLDGTQDRKRDDTLQR